MILLARLVLFSQIALSQEHAVYKSVDRGATWTKAGANLPATSRINAFGAAGDRIFAGTDSGVYSSGNQGQTWQNTSVTTRITSFVTSANTIYAGSATAGLYASQDHGMSWTPAPGLASEYIRSLAAAQGRLYAGTDRHGVKVSEDGGATWKDQNAGLPAFSQVFDLAMVNGTLFAALYAKGLYVWSNNEQRWSRAGNVQPLVLAPAGGALAIGHNPGALFWSRRPETADWIQATGDFASSSPVWEMGSDDRLVVAGMADGIFTSEDHGRTWARRSAGLPAKSPGVSFLVRGDTIFAGVIVAPEVRR